MTTNEFILFIPRDEFERFSAIAPSFAGYTQLPAILLAGYLRARWPLTDEERTLIRLACPGVKINPI